MCQEQELHERVGPVQPTGALQGAQGEGGDRERRRYSQVRLALIYLITKTTLFAEIIMTVISVI